MRAGWLVIAAGLGCELPEVIAVGTHVEVAADPGYELCGGTIAHMDAFIAATAAEFGVAAPRGNGRIPYFGVDEGYVDRTGCPWFSSGCESSGRIYSRSAPLDHEFVHALDDVGRAPPFFGEGLAVAYGGIDEGHEIDLRWFSVYETLTVRESREVNYAVAGAFTWFLVERHGIADVLRVADELPRRISVSRVEESFREILGVALDESVAEFEAAVAACPDRQWRALLIECAAPAIAWDGAWFAEHRALACAQEDVVGPYGGDAAVIFKTVEVVEDGRFDVNVIAEGGSAEVAITPCGGCEGTTWAYAGEGAARAELAAGKYAVRVIGPALADISVGWSLRRVGE
jgi:hypothetical protein